MSLSAPDCGRLHALVTPLVTRTLVEATNPNKFWSDRVGTRA